ncbi:MAG: hypothetical protein IPN76_33585 [Saprospiraceae bacterium]|nr:hypothetical protein [Saprospiraceae bacterium]
MNISAKTGLHHRLDYDGWQQLRRGSFVVMLGECPDDRSAFDFATTPISPTCRLTAWTNCTRSW